MDEIKLFVACHTPRYVPEHPFLVPVQTGCAQAKERYPGMLQDNTGDNISERNDFYCELTAMYWAWKNVVADYYGFMHDRRYLSFSEEAGGTDDSEMMLDMIDDRSLQRLGFDPAVMRRIIESHDMVLLEPLNISKMTGSRSRTVEQQYAGGFQHDIRDLHRAVQVVLDCYPEYAEDARAYLKSPNGWFLNIFVMKRAYFDAFCQWLFPILEILYQELDPTSRNGSIYERRKIGFLAERLMGIYIFRLRRLNPGLKCFYTKIGFFACSANPYPKPSFVCENQTAVCLACGNDYAPLASVLLASILKNSDLARTYDFILLSDGLTESHRQMFHRQVKGYANVCLRILEISRSLRQHALPSTLHITAATFSRIFALEYMRNYEKVLYLDCDMVADRDIGLLYAQDPGDAALCAVRDTSVASWYKIPEHDQRAYMEASLPSVDPNDYFNAGVLLMNVKKMISMHSAEALLNMALARTWRWLDQDLLNMAYQGHVRYLNASWNVIVHTGGNELSYPETCAPFWIAESYKDARKHPGIIHYAGHLSPCFVPDTDMASFFWKYARETEVYEQLLAQASNAAKFAKIGRKGRIESLPKRIILGIGHRFPANTWIGRKLRRIYYNLRKFRPVHTVALNKGGKK